MFFFCIAGIAGLSVMEDFSRRWRHQALGVVVLQVVLQVVAELVEAD